MNFAKLVMWRRSRPELRLEFVQLGDLEQLRVWKNDNRQFFFHKEIISPIQQEAWFKDFLVRSDDYMFIVRLDGEAIGCIGYRLTHDFLEVYNVILKEEYRGHGYMSEALYVGLAYMWHRYGSRQVIAKVLKNGPVGWYFLNGFMLRERYKDHFVMNAYSVPVPDISVEEKTDDFSVWL